MLARAWADFGLGLSCLRMGFASFRRHPELRRLLLLPLVLNVLLMGATLAAIYWVFPALVEKLFSVFPAMQRQSEGFWMSLFAPVLQFLFWILRGVIFVLLLLLLGALAYVLSAIINAPVYDLISERLEMVITGTPAQAFSLARCLAEFPGIVFKELKKALLFLGVPLALLLCNAVPLVGNVLYCVLLNAFLLWGQGLMYADYPLARHGWDFQQTMGYARRNAFALMGLGVPVFIPLLNLFLTPFCIAGGTFLFLETKRREISL